MNDIINLLEQAIPEIVLEATSTGLSGEVEKVYQHAVEVLRCTPHEFIPAFLDRFFRERDARFSFVYDHIKECYQRADVLSYEEYTEFNRRFPRTR